MSIRKFRNAGGKDKKRILLLSVIILFLAILNAGVAFPFQTVSLNTANTHLDQNRLRVHFIDIGPGLAV
jgi:hypothetical protein